MSRPTYSDEKEEPPLGGQSQNVQYVTKADLDNAIDAVEKRFQDLFDALEKRFQDLFDAQEKRFQDLFDAQEKR